MLQLFKGQCCTNVSSIWYFVKEGQPVAEEIQPMEVIVTASMPKAQPPRIIKPITDAEVMEGEKWVHFSSPSLM